MTVDLIYEKMRDEGLLDGYAYSVVEDTANEFKNGARPLSELDVALVDLIDISSQEAFAQGFKCAFKLIRDALNLDIPV